MGLLRPPYAGKPRIKLPLTEEAPLSTTKIVHAAQGCTPTDEIVNPGRVFLYKGSRETAARGRLRNL
jgi:hypothetical protein